MVRLQVFGSVETLVTKTEAGQAVTSQVIGVVLSGRTACRLLTIALGLRSHMHRV
jgi:hypothetical protein